MAGTVVVRRGRRHIDDEDHLAWKRVTGEADGGLLAGPDADDAIGLVEFSLRVVAEEIPVGIRLGDQQGAGRQLRGGGRRRFRRAVKHHLQIGGLMPGGFVHDPARQLWRPAGIGIGRGDEKRRLRIGVELEHSGQRVDAVAVVPEDRATRTQHFEGDRALHLRFVGELKLEGAVRSDLRAANGGNPGGGAGGRRGGARAGRRRGQLELLREEGLDAVTVPIWRGDSGFEGAGDHGSHVQIPAFTAPPRRSRSACSPCPRATRRPRSSRRPGIFRPPPSGG